VLQAKPRKLLVTRAQYVVFLEVTFHHVRNPCSPALLLVSASGLPGIASKPQLESTREHVELSIRFLRSNSAFTTRGCGKAHILGIHPTSLLHRLKKQHLDN
jgi:hypothetical protein